MKTETTDLKIGEFLTANRDYIIRLWNSSLLEHTAFQEPKRLALLRNEQKEKQDFLTLVQKYESAPEQDLTSALKSIVNRIHTSFYSITDFSIETYCLDASIFRAFIENGFPAENLPLACSRLRKDIFNVSQMILQETVGVYEYVVENGKRAFSYFGRDGEILYSNKAMRLMMETEEPDRHKKIFEFFNPADGEIIQKMVSDASACASIFGSLNFNNSQGKEVPVGAEICPVILDGRPAGGYASLINLEIILESQKRVYDKSPVGIIKVNKKNEFMYANPAAQEILGSKELEGKSIRRLFVKDSAWEIVKKQLENRFKKGMAGEYETEITTFGRRARNIPIRISGIPETDLKGDITGSMALIHSLELEKAGNKIHRAIENFKDMMSLYENVATIVHGLVPFREMIVSTFSSDLKHVRSITWQPGEGFIEQAWEGVWWAIPESMNGWLLNKKNTYVPDMEAFFKQPEWSELLKNPAIQSFMEKKLHAMVRCLIFRGQKLIATLSFFRGKKDGFSPAEIAKIKKLPLRKAILTARYEAEKARMKFRLDLLKEIHTVCDDLGAVGETIVKNLSTHYGWHNVSFFSVDRANKVFRLKGQWALDRGQGKSFLLPEKYTQPIDEGVLGHVCEHKEIVNISNIKEDRKFKDCFIDGYKDTISELCYPILVRDKVCWLLNIEDARENAFSKDQIDSLTLIVQEVGEILKRAHTLHIHQVTFESTSDAVITTDFEGNIQTINPAGERMLQMGTGSPIGKSLRDYFEDKELFDWLKSDPRTISGKEVFIHGGEKKNNHVLLSSSALPEELGGRVFIAKDLSLLKRIKELEYLDQMSYEVALQTKTPLALMFSWLGRISRCEPAEQADLIEKLIRQLKKIELTTDRLALFEEGKGLVPYHELVLDFPEVMGAVKKDLPETEANKIHFTDEGAPSFKGDMFQIKFCLETILSYLLRYLPRDNQIEVEVTSTEDRVKCRIKGILPEPDSDGLPEDKGAVRQTLKDIALGERIIRQFIQGNHNGRYIHSEQYPGQFEIDLPIRKTSHE